MNASEPRGINFDAAPMQKYCHCLFLRPKTIRPHCHTIESAPILAGIGLLTTQSSNARISCRSSEADIDFSGGLNISAGRMSVKATVEAARQDDVATLLRQSDLVAELLYPGEFRRPITADYLANPGTHVLVARLVGEAVGMCVVFDRGDATIEVKRMIVDHNARGRGAGSSLLDAAHSHGVALGARLALLEVGTRNVEAQALYRKAGYMFRGPFAPHNASPISLFMERAI